MSAIVDDVAQQCLLPDGHSTLFDALPQFDEDLAEDVVADSLSLSPPPAEPVDEAPGPSGNSLPATPAERPTTFSPVSLPLPVASCPGRATLVLDLDGTLISSEELNSVSSAFLYNPPAGARNPDYEAMGRRVWLRPGVKEFLAAVRPHFEIVLFTAATQNWAAAAIEQLDPSAYLFDVMLHRDHTISDLMWDYVKDLSRLGRDLARVVIVDDNPLMFMYQPDNALHVGAYEPGSAGGPDNVLERVAEVLISQVVVSEDVREVLGPMASAKACITNTVYALAAAAAADTSAEACERAVASAAAVPAAEPMDMASGDGSAAAANASSEEEGCGHDNTGTLAAMWSGPAQEEEGSEDDDDAEEEEDDAQAVAARVDEHEEGPAFEWDDADSEGAEAFDEHGAAARLGADEHGVGVHRYSWDGDHARAEAAVSSSEDGDAEEEQDADQASEEQDADEGGHGSDDFDALMEDAIAEYDSDAYDGQRDSELDFPAESAAAAIAAAALLVERPEVRSGCRSGSAAACAAVPVEAAPCAGSGNIAGAGAEEVGHQEATAAAAAAEFAGACAGESPPLPTGMVFLTDLNPTLRAGAACKATTADAGSSGAACKATAADAGSSGAACKATAADAGSTGATAPASRGCCKRGRVEEVDECASACTRARQDSVVTGVTSDASEL